MSGMASCLCSWARMGAVLIAPALLSLVIAGTAAAEESGPLPARSGEQIYTRICQGCHMADGRGAEGAGVYPPLTASPVFASPAFIAVTVLNGRRNMPAFASSPRRDDFFESTALSDEEVANVVNYIRTNFGNEYTDRVSAADIAALPHP
jgi:mono/diheme cytochrome c family protein